MVPNGERARETLLFLSARLIKQEVREMITYEYKFGYYTVYLNGKFLETCENFRELKEICARYGVSI